MEMSWINRGAALFEEGRFGDAKAAFEHAINANPHDSAAWCNLGAVLQQMGRLHEAEHAYKRSLSISPGDVDAISNYGYLLAHLGKVPESLDVLGGLLARCPDHREGLFNQSLIMFKASMLSAAESSIRRLLGIEPNSSTAWSLLGAILEREARIPEALHAFRKSISLEPNAHRHSKLLCCMQYSEEFGPEDLLRAHQEWDFTYAVNIDLPDGDGHSLATADHWSRERPRPLRIGILSEDFGLHPFAFAALNVFELLDKRKCSLYFYSDQLAEDDYTGRFRATGAAWKNTYGESDEAVADQIRRDSIDVLIDPMGHTGKRLRVFARRPAPVQITWFGYVGTTGLCAIDFLIADGFHLRENEERYYTEKILRMTNDYACYRAPDNAPNVDALPATLTDLYFTFGCFSNPAKFGPTILNAWAIILARVPRGRLFLKYGGLDDVEMQKRIVQRFGDRGIDRDRILFEGWSPQRELMASYNRVDIALDTQPYSGGITTCEALWMGVPVITFPGRTFAGRHATSHMINAGYSQFVASDLDGYIELAVNWANRLDELVVMRSQMREQMRQSPLCDAPRFARDFLEVIERAWQAKISAP